MYRELRTYSPLVILLLGMLVFVANAVRLSQPVIGNADIAGIFYNADLINDGGLPYVDSLEHKSPLSFFISAGLFKVFGRDLIAVDVVFNLWLCFGALAVGTAASVLFGGSGGRRGWKSGCVAAGLFLMSASQFEYNYSGWMAPAYIASFALAVVASRHGHSVTWVLSGIAFTFAFLLKAFAITLAPAIALVWWLRRDQTKWVSGPAAWCLGVCLGFAPLIWLYASEGALFQLAAGVFPSDHASRYLGATIVPLPWWQLAGKAAWQAYETFPLVIALTGAAILIGFRLRVQRETLLIAAAFVAVSVLGVALGGSRFYRHYLIQYLPAFAILAAHPRLWSFLSLALAKPTLKRQMVMVGLFIFAAPQLLHVIIAQPLGYRYDNRQVAAQAAAEYVEGFTTPSSSILAWGWDAWPVYYWSDRKAPGTVYKELGAVTTLNNNSSFFAGQTPRFHDAEAATLLLQEVESNPPQAIVIGGFYGVPTREQPYPGPLKEFEALRDFLHQHYECDRVFGDLMVMRPRQVATAASQTLRVLPELD